MSRVKKYLKDESGQIFLPIVLISSLIGLLTVSVGSLYVASLEKAAAKEPANRAAESAAHSALEMTNALIHGHVLIKDSTKGDWTYRDPSGSNDDSAVIFQPPKTAWLDTLPDWAKGEIQRKSDSEAKLLIEPPIPISAGMNNYPLVAIPTPLGAAPVPGPGPSPTPAALVAPEEPTLVYNFGKLIPVVRLTRGNSLGGDISVSVYDDKIPFPKTINARVGGFCRNFDPEPVTMLYRNFLGRDPHKSRDPLINEVPNYEFQNLYPIVNNDIDSVIEGLKKQAPDNSKIIEERLKNPISSSDLANELYQMYLYREPSTEESDFLVNQLKSNPYATIESAMKTSPIFRFINEKNGSHYYTNDEEDGKKQGFNYDAIAFYVWGSDSTPPFAPASEMAPLHLCHNESTDPKSDYYFVSVNCPPSSKMEKRLGYVYTNVQDSWAYMTQPLYEFALASGNADLLATVDTEVPGYDLTPGQISSKKGIAFVSVNDAKLASAIALYRTYFVDTLDADAYATNAILSEAREWAPKENLDLLSWLSQSLRSRKVYHETEGCVATKAPAPRCYLVGPTQVPSNTPASVELHVFGEFTSIKWNGMEVSEIDDRSKIGPDGIIAKPNAPFSKVKEFTTADGKIDTHAEVSIVIDGKTLLSTCTLAQKSVELTVKPNFDYKNDGIPDKSPEGDQYVVNKNAAAQFVHTITFKYKTTNFDSPHCLIVSTDRSYVSDPLTDAEGTVIMKGSGIEAKTEFTLTCSDSDHTKASTRATARVYPPPTCNISGCLTTTVGYSTSLTLSADSYPSTAIWDSAFVSNFPSIQPRNGGTSTANVKGPGGNAICSATVTEIDLPPPDWKSVPCGGNSAPGCTQMILVPAPIPLPTNCGAPPIATPSPSPSPTAVPSPTPTNVPKLSCRGLRIHPGKKYTCNAQKVAQFQIWIPANSKMPVIDILYGKKQSPTYGPCQNPQPPPPPTEYVDPATGAKYSLVRGSKDCKIHVEDQSPLMFNLDDEPIKLTSPSAGPEFDLQANGSEDHYSWPGNPSKSVFLAFDRNGDGIINDSQELFGNHNSGLDSKKTSNGFEALKKYDLNHDGVINHKDAIFKKLSVWFAYYQNGKLQRPSVLKTLNEVGVESILLNYVEQIEGEDAYGNKSKQRSVIQMKDRSVRNLFDMWLVSE